jgi:hypothetical protein
MKYRYYICDVFTDTRFGGNQLAVLPDAADLSERQMMHAPASLRGVSHRVLKWDGRARCRHVLKKGC